MTNWTGNFPKELPLHLLCEALMVTSGPSPP